MNKKVSAAILLFVHSASLLVPNITYGLTNGPSQPEATQFQAASVSNLVDPATGDFSYNIPLMDVDGYPLNLAYSSGGGMDDEATWVGYGWNLNPGSVSRVMKGIPDEFDGTDIITKQYHMKDDITGGVSFNVSTEVFGLDFLGANASADVFYNNKRGLGVEIGAGISADFCDVKPNAGVKNSGLFAGGNLGITSNSQTGADFNFGINAGIKQANEECESGSLGFRFGGSLNSRAGLKSTTLGASFNTSKCENKFWTDWARETGDVASGSSTSSFSLGSATSNYGQAFTPTIVTPMKNESYSLTPMAGPEFWGFNVPTLQLTGHYSKQKVASKNNNYPAYGFVHAVKGRSDPKALLDFNREKDVPFLETTPTLGVPYITQDIFTATSQFGSSQFKAFSNSSGIFFDTYADNTSDAFQLGVEFGIGGGIKGGADLSGNGTTTVTRKWLLNNDFALNGDFYNNTNLDGENAYFKLVGEKSSINKDFQNKIVGSDPVKIKTAVENDQAKAYSAFSSNNSNYQVSSKISKNRREPRGELFSPLTAERADKFALDRKIKSYQSCPVGSIIPYSNGNFGSFESLDRINGTRKKNHFSEINVLKNNGMRLCYGIPVYNNIQNDVTFSVEGTPNDKNLITYSPADNSTENKKGMDHYFSKEIIPAYPTSFLLTAVCSPDYIDRTGNGVTDDDIGTAIKFNYNRAQSAYKWRTPTASGITNYANYAEGNKSDNKDDKASLSYGTKEIWYLNSIESKNMIAIFRTGARDDGFGFKPDGTVDNNSAQKKLERIDLYTKAELISNPSNPVPVKSAHFVYDYSLFPGLPNNVNSGGKLTLKSVYFTYGNSLSGERNRYKFTYNESGQFQYQQYDRWGNYKDKSFNASFAGINLNNNDFPYTIQDKQTVDEWVSKWQLSKIELPSGGVINVEYESDDYAFVQDKRAMEMAKIVGYGSYGQYQGYQETDKVFIQLPGTVSSLDELKSKYFENVEQLYFKTSIDLDNANHNELVSGYAKVLNVGMYNNQTAVVTLEKRGNYHPIAAAAWQHMRLNLPNLAYQYSVNESLSPLEFVKALIAAIRNVGELLTPFESKAMRQQFASKIIQDQGYARITNNYNKLGGGLRVKKILINDKWSEIVGQGNGTSTSTGMMFEYTRDIKTSDGQSRRISSGVASYEPMPGGEENPFRQPNIYQQKQHLSANLYTVEEPLGESYFPSPGVSYSEVKIVNLNAEGQPVSNGYTIKKYFTAKDFPTIARRTDLTTNKYNQKSLLGLFDIDNGNSVVLSQGFYVETNDMHGKPLSEETFDGSGKMISGSYYHYKMSGNEQYRLDNNALTLHADGSVQSEVIGQESEMYHDMREQVTDNTGVSLNINLDVLYFVLFVVPVPTAIPIVQSTYCGYQSAATIKLVNRYAIQDKVTVIENGSTVTTENIVWDALTGEVVLTKTQNGFNDPIYNFNLPAYMAAEYEKGMGAAYKNSGITFTGIAVSNGAVPSNMAGYLVAGDELGVLSDGSKLNVLSSPGGLKLITNTGELYSGTSNLVLLRSGRRNLLAANTFSVVSLKSPIQNGKIEINQSTQVINTTASTYSDEWKVDYKSFDCSNVLGMINGCRCWPVEIPVNPYKTGLKGNWSPFQSYVYFTDRDAGIDPSNTAEYPTNLRKGGVLQTFTPFYKIQNGSFVTGYQADNKWIANNTVTALNNKGQETENKDALGKYKCTQNGFNNLLPVAVCDNARTQEIAYDGFEDFSLRSALGQSSVILGYTCNLNLEHLNPLKISISSNEAHTGKYSIVSQYGECAVSYEFNGLRTQFDNTPQYAFNSQNQYIFKFNGFNKIFNPLLGKKYIITGWIKGKVKTEEADGAKLVVRLGDMSLPPNSPALYEVSTIKAGPKIEGWTRVMAVFELPINVTSPWLRIEACGYSNETSYFDDIRIQPYDAVMKSYAYDYRNMKLMAELDENNYATFFEYNDEGQLIRNKKETEKGIVTLKETRSSVKPNTY